MNYQSDDRMHVVDCVQQQRFDHVDHLETLEMNRVQRNVFDRRRRIPG